MYILAILVAKFRQNGHRAEVIGHGSVVLVVDVQNLKAFYEILKQEYVFTIVLTFNYHWEIINVRTNYPICWHDCKRAYLSWLMNAYRFMAYLLGRPFLFAICPRANTSIIQGKMVRTHNTGENRPIPLSTDLEEVDICWFALRPMNDKLRSRIEDYKKFFPSNICNLRNRVYNLSSSLQF